MWEKMPKHQTINIMYNGLKTVTYLFMLIYT